MVKQRFDWIDIIIYTVLGLLSITMLYPFLNMLAVSFAPISEVMENSSMLFRKTPHLMHITTFSNTVISAMPQK